MNALTNIGFLERFENTSGISISAGLADQIIGQDHAVDAVRLAARQRRFLLIAGEPGTGKSMLGRAAAELMNSDRLFDIIADENPENKNIPLIRITESGKGEELIQEEIRAQKRSLLSEVYLLYLLSAALFITAGTFSYRDGNFMWVFAAALAMYPLWKLKTRLYKHAENSIPKIIVGNTSRRPPFIDATGFGEGALLGDVRHDPYQSGGMETPPHILIEAGAIHQACGGVLYIDEVSMLSQESQVSLLTAIQEKEMSITGRSPGSSGMMIRSMPVPCDFMLVIAGNMEDLSKIHPALRSRIKGYGYEIYTSDSMPLNEKNAEKLVRFIAQEVIRDGRIPHFSRSGVLEILRQAVIRSGKSNMFTLKLRELGGLVRIAGDVAVRYASPFVEGEHVSEAALYSRSIDEQKNFLEMQDE